MEISRQIALPYRDLPCSQMLEHIVCKVKDSWNHDAVFTVCASSVALNVMFATIFLLCTRLVQDQWTETISSKRSLRAVALST